MIMIMKMMVTMIQKWCIQKCPLRSGEKVLESALFALFALFACERAGRIRVWILRHTFWPQICSKWKCKTLLLLFWKLKGQTNISLSFPESETSLLYYHPKVFDPHLYIRFYPWVHFFSLPPSHTIVNWSFDNNRFPEHFCNFQGWTRGDVYKQRRRILFPPLHIYWPCSRRLYNSVQTLYWPEQLLPLAFKKSAKRQKRQQKEIFQISHKEIGVQKN